MVTRIAALLAGLAVALVLAPAEAAARGGHWHGGGGYYGGGYHGGGPRGGFGVFVGPPAWQFRSRGWGHGYGRPYGYGYGYGRPYGSYVPPPYLPPPAYYAPPPAYLYAPPRIGYRAPVATYLPSATVADGGYKR